MLQGLRRKFAGSLANGRNKDITNHGHYDNKDTLKCKETKMFLVRWIKIRAVVVEVLVEKLMLNEIV